MSKTKEIEGQYSFEIAADGTLSYRPLADDEERERNKQQKRKTKIMAYYENYLVLFKRYGRFAQFYGLWMAFEKEKPSIEAINALNYHFDGDRDNVQVSLNRARYWLDQAIKSTSKLAVDLALPDIKYDDAYRDKERRDKHKSYVKAELKKLGKMELKEIPAYEPYTPNDLEMRYQYWRATRKPRQPRKPKPID